MMSIPHKVEKKKEKDEKGRTIKTTVREPDVDKNEGGSLLFARGNVHKD